MSIRTPGDPPCETAPVRNRCAKTRAAQSLGIDTVRGSAFTECENDYQVRNKPPASASELSSAETATTIFSGYGLKAVMNST
jgi:hypothetical protein